MAISDFLQVRSANLFVRLMGIAGYGIIIAAILQIAFFSGTVGIPLLLVTGWLLSILSGGLLIYSVFIEIPLIKKRHYSPQSTAVMEGTYRLCRHPGFWWLLFLLASLIMVHGNSASVVRSLYIVVLNLGLIILEDRFFFPRIFDNYREYKKAVPFLIPNFGRKGQKGEQKKISHRNPEDGA